MLGTLASKGPEASLTVQQIRLCMTVLKALKNLLLFLLPSKTVVIR